jgi:L-glyceraldehyde 3-phosphate reductase
MLTRWVEEDGLTDTLDDLGIGSIAFTPLAQGMLTNKYLGGIPAEGRAAQGKSLNADWLTDEVIERLKGLNAIAEARGQTLAQMAIAWVLRENRITTALIGASKPSQVEDCVGAVANLEFSSDELSAIDELCDSGNINLWSKSSDS